MSNEEIYKNLAVIFDSEMLEVFCIVNSAVHEILAIEDYENKNTPSEHQYDFEWWSNKAKELS